MKTEIVKLQMVRESTMEYEARISTAEQAAEIVRKLTKNDPDEHFYVLALDTKNRINHIYEAAKGGSDSVTMNVRDLFRCAVLANASGIIVAHNHPSGDTEPSQQDVVITKRIKEACELLGFRFMDSLVVTSQSFQSITARAF